MRLSSSDTTASNTGNKFRQRTVYLITKVADFESERTFISGEITKVEDDFGHFEFFLRQKECSFRGIYLKVRLFRALFRAF